ncbi:MAG: transposase DNA-binding-containing protein [Planctomycetota bacterium]|nr:transposase DNA-binding-containing protein [Planctomycetota bacterium]
MNLWESGLGDQRLNERNQQVIEALSVDPQASLNESLSRWEEALATYRQFDNPSITPEATLERFSKHPPREDY